MEFAVCITRPLLGALAFVHGRCLPSGLGWLDAAAIRSCPKLSVTVDVAMNCNQGLMDLTELTRMGAWAAWHGYPCR